jgi:hypothetical protein
MLVDELNHFCQRTGIEESLLKEGETLDTVNLASVLTADKFVNLTKSDLVNLQEKFGEALNLNISLHNAPAAYTFIKIGTGQAQTDFDDGLGKLKQRPATTDIRLNLTLDKTVILRRFALMDNGYDCFFYFFKDNFNKLLKASLLQIDSLLFKAKSMPCLVLISDSRYSFTGKLLHIFGEARVEEVKKLSFGLTKDLEQQLARFYADDLSKPSWIGFKISNLTPLHFLGSLTGAGTEADAKVILGHLLNLCILYTANRSSYNEQTKSFHAIYANSERTVELDLGSQLSPSVASKETLPKLVEWISTGKDTDRLTIFRNIVARVLDGDNPAENYNLLAGILVRIFGEAQWHYLIFTDGKINKHFEEVKKLNDYIAEVAKKVSESIDSITKGVTDALLATVGVLVVTVLAALVKNEATGSIFMISMSIYAVYLLFYAGYRMSSIGHNYWLLKLDASEQIETYNITLRKEKVDELKKPFTRRRAQFVKWFWITVVIYILLALGVWMAGNYAPQYLINKGLIKPAAPPSPSPNPTPTPSATSTAP